MPSLSYYQDSHALKTQFDYAFTSGVNGLVEHSFSAHPFTYRIYVLPDYREGVTESIYIYGEDAHRRYIGRLSFPLEGVGDLRKRLTANQRLKIEEFLEGRESEKLNVY
jgi:hypothetical protein